MGNDRRRSPRLPSSVEMHIATHEDWHRVWLVDVSSHGARFRGVHLPRRGTRICVAVRVPCHVLQLHGAIAWNEKHRAAAVEFDPLTREQQVSLNTGLLESDGDYASPGARGAVLLMIDDPTTQAAIGRAVRDCGFRLIARTTPLDAIQSLVSAGSRLHAAIISVELPHRAGHDVLDFLAREYPEVRCAVLGERGELEEGRASDGRPACALSQPYRAEEIGQMLGALDRVVGVDHATS
jgi:hypothetical protein